MSFSYSSNNNSKGKKVEICFTDFIHNVNCNINEKTFAENIHMIFVSGCGLDVYGFDSINREYWGKKITKNRCVFHFTLSINENCEITIKLVIGTKDEIINLSKQILAVTKLINLM